MSVPRCRLFRRDIESQPPSPSWELSTRNSTGSKVLVYIPRAEGRSRRRIQGSNPLTTSRLYRRTPSSRTPRSCLERENDSRPRSNSVDRVLGHQGNARRNLKTRLTGWLRETEARILINKIRTQREIPNANSQAGFYNRSAFPWLKKSIIIFFCHFLGIADEKIKQNLEKIKQNLINNSIINISNNENSS